MSTEFSRHTHTHTLLEGEFSVLELTNGPNKGDVVIKEREIARLQTKKPKF